MAVVGPVLDLRTVKARMEEKAYAFPKPRFGVNVKENQLFAVVAVATDVAVVENPLAPHAPVAAVDDSAMPDARCSPAEVAPASIEVGANGDGPKLLAPPGQFAEVIAHEIKGTAGASASVSAATR